MRGLSRERLSWGGGDTEPVLVEFRSIRPKCQCMGGFFPLSALPREEPAAGWVRHCAVTEDEELF